ACSPSSSTQEMWVSMRRTGRPRRARSRPRSASTRASSGPPEESTLPATPRARSARGPCPVDVPADPAGDDLPALVDGLLLQADEATVGLRGRAPGLEHVEAAAQDVAGTHRCEPAQLVEPGGAHARDFGDEAVGEHPHHDRAGVPAARDQAAVGGALRRLGVDVEGLRIVALRELDDLFLGDQVLVELDDLTGLIILEPALLERNLAH